MSLLLTQREREQQDSFVGYDVLTGHPTKTEMNAPPAGGVVPSTMTNSGLHEFVAQRVLATHVRPGARAADLGTGPGAMAARLAALGCEVLAVDRESTHFQGGVPHRVVDLNDAHFASSIQEHAFDIVTAIEVIEHLESPINFVRNVAQMLAPGGIAVLTTPNVDSLPSRLKFLLAGKIRTMDERGDPTHISPIFFELFRRQYLLRTGARLSEHFLFPQTGYQLTRRPLAWILRVASTFLPGECLLGDNHVFVLQAQP